MQIDRKNSSNFKKINHSQAKDNQDNRKHLLQRPNLTRFSAGKLTQSFSTLHSQNMSKYSAKNKKKAPKQRKSSNNIIQKQIRRVATELKIGLSRIGKKNIIKQEQKQNLWNNEVQNIKKKTRNSHIISLIDTIQKGYQKKYQKQTAGNKLLQQKTIKNETKAKPKLCLNIQNIEKEDILDYHDEFMSKIEQFSPSWRCKLEIEQKRMH